MWPFQTKQLIAYLGTDHFTAWETRQVNGQPASQQLQASTLEQLEASIRIAREVPSSFGKYQSTLRLAPSLARCYTLPAAQSSLGNNELQGLATYWAKTLMGLKWNTWNWQAVQSEIQQPILLCAHQVDTGYLNAFRKVKPELLYLMDTLEDRDSAWVISQDDVLVQSALVIEGAIVSIHTWPANYTSSAEEVIHKHGLLSDKACSFTVHRIVESRLGEVYQHGAL